MIFIGGIDEAGRGPLAGPVTAACCVLPEGFSHTEITDSKKLSEKTRARLFPEIQEAAIAFSIISVGPRRIDHLNIREATKVAMKLAADRVYRQLQNKFGRKAQLSLLIDGNMKIETDFPQETIIKGDEKVLAIGAASILAKVTRDRLMEVLGNKYPGYNLELHKGYPTAKHREQIALIGPSPVHRKSFAGVCPAAVSTAG